MGIGPSIAPVYEKDERGVRRLVGYKASGPTESQRKRGIKPKEGFGVDTPKQEQAVKAKAVKIAKIQEKKEEKPIKRTTRKKKSDA